MSSVNSIGSPFYVHLICFIRIVQVQYCRALYKHSCYDIRANINISSLKQAVAFTLQLALIKLLVAIIGQFKTVCMADN